LLAGGFAACHEGVGQGVADAVDGALVLLDQLLLVALQAGAAFALVVLLLFRSHCVGVEAAAALALVVGVAHDFEAIVEQRDGLLQRVDVAQLGDRRHLLPAARAGRARGQAFAGCADAGLDVGFADAGLGAELADACDFLLEALFLGQELGALLVPGGAGLGAIEILLAQIVLLLLQAQGFLDLGDLLLEQVDAGLVAGACSRQQGAGLGLEAVVELLAQVLEALLVGVFAAQAEHGVPGLFGEVLDAAPGALEVAQAGLQSLGALLDDVGIGGLRSGGGVGLAALVGERADLRIDRFGEKVLGLVELDECVDGLFAQGGELLGQLVDRGAAGALHGDAGGGDALDAVAGDARRARELSQHLRGLAGGAGDAVDARGHLRELALGHADLVARERQRAGVGVDLLAALEGGDAQRRDGAGRQVDGGGQGGEIAAHALERFEHAAIRVLDLAALLDQHHVRRHAAAERGDDVRHLHRQVAVGLAQHVGLRVGLTGRGAQLLLHGLRGRLRGLHAGDGLGAQGLERGAGGAGLRGGVLQRVGDLAQAAGHLGGAGELQADADEFSHGGVLRLRRCQRRGRLRVACSRCCSAQVARVLRSMTCSSASRLRTRRGGARRAMRMQASTPA
jgi:hypothetical protein